MLISLFDHQLHDSYTETIASVQGSQSGSDSSSRSEGCSQHITTVVRGFFLAGVLGSLGFGGFLGLRFRV